LTYIYYSFAAKELHATVHLLDAVLRDLFCAFKYVSVFSFDVTSSPCGHSFINGRRAAAWIRFSCQLVKELYIVMLMK